MHGLPRTWPRSSAAYPLYHRQSVRYPAFVYRVTDAGREEDNTHPLTRLIRNGPNSKQTWPDFLEWLIASTLLRGNGLVEIITDGGGRVTELVPIPWEYVSVQLLPNGRLAFDIVATTSLYGATGKLRRLLEGEVLFLKDRSDDALIGRSRLSRAGAVVSTALAIQEFSGALYENSANPSGVLQGKGTMNDAQLARLADNFRQAFGGPSKAAKALVLDQGLEWKSISISPEDAELLASRRFTGEELARLYNVPPPIIGDLTHGTFTNSETLIRFFAQSTLTGWVRKIEAEFHRSVLSEASRIDRQFVLDLSGLLRGDPETRWKSHEIALRNQVLTPNEIRGEEGWNPRPGGDAVTTPATPPNFAAAQRRTQYVRVYKLSKEYRRALTDLAAGVLRLGEPTVFAFEATCRHGLRSNLCLQSWPWIVADATADAVVQKALHRLGARRPRWIQGQREYTSEGVTKIERTNCIQCGNRLPENHFKFCSKKCAGDYRNETLDEERREADRARKLARAFEYRLQVEAKTCEVCSRSFKPNYPEQRFCSRT